MRQALQLTLLVRLATCLYLNIRKFRIFSSKSKIDAIDNLSCREFAPPLSTYAKMTSMFTLVKLKKL